MLALPRESFILARWTVNQVMPGQAINNNQTELDVPHVQEFSEAKWLWLDGEAECEGAILCEPKLEALIRIFRYNE